MEKRIQVSEKIQRFIKSLKRHPDCFEFEQVSENEYVLYYEDYPHPPIINSGPQTFKALYRKPKKGQTIFAHILHKYFPTIKDYKLAGRCNTLQEELNEIFIAEKNKGQYSES